MPNRNIYTATGSLSASAETVTLGARCESLYIRNADAANTISVTLGDAVVDVGPGVVKKVDRVVQSFAVSCASTAVYHVVALEDGEARFEFKSLGGGSSTPTQEYLSAAAMTVTAMVDSVLVNMNSTCTLTLPAITTALDSNITSIKMEIADVSGAAGTNAITIQPNAGDTGTLINGAATVSISADYGSVTLQAVNYDGITYGGGHSHTMSGKHWKLS